MMKKILLITALAATCCMAFLSQRSYASSEKVKDPNPRTTKAIHQDFPQAKQITWKREKGNFIATFDMYDSKVTACYDSEGKLLSTLILISVKSLPFEIRTNLARKYPDYEVKCVREYMDKGKNSYFFILKKQESHRINWLSIKLNARKGFITLQELDERV